MDAALPLHLRVDALALDDGDHFFVSADAGLGKREQLDLPAMLLCEALIHTENFSGKEGGFVATCAGADFENDVLLVVGVLGQQQDLDFFLEDGLARGEGSDFFLGHGAEFGVALREHGAGFGETLTDLLEFAIFCDGGLKLAQGAAGFLILLVVADDLGHAHLHGELVVALLHLFQTINHG